MSIRACNNAQITGPVLSREITKLVTERTKAGVALFKNERPTRPVSLWPPPWAKGGREENESAATLSQ